MEIHGLLPEKDRQAGRQAGRQGDLGLWPNIVPAGLKTRKKVEKTCIACTWKDADK
jgi:hypothetical protein